MEESEKKNLNTATSLPMSTMVNTQASSQWTRNVLYESESSYFVAKGTSLHYVGGSKQLKTIIHQTLALLHALPTTNATTS